MDLGMLRVVTPDGQTREYPIDVPTVFIGRAEGNRVVIDHVSVSRRHARLVIDPGGVTLEDLGSASGTFVGAQRLQPNSPQVIFPGHELRFGDVEAWFIGAFEASAAPVQVVRGPGPAAADTRQTVAVAVHSPSAPVAAGSPTTATVSIQNRGAVADDFTISVPDLPPSWVRVSRTALSLPPGAREEVTVVITPPPGPESLAGEHQLSVAVVSRVEGVEVRALGRLVILPFEDLRCELRPQRSRRDFVLTAFNAGNAPTGVALAGVDDQSALRFQFEPDALELGPGEGAGARVRVQPARRRLLGKPEARPFRAEARPALAGQHTASADGVLDERSLLGPWIWLIVAALVVAAVTAAGYGYTRVCGSSWPLCPADDQGSSPPSSDATPGPTRTATPGRTATAGKTATVVPTPTGIHKGGKAVVINSAPNPPTNDNCLALRSSPGINPAAPGDNILRRLCDGAEVSILDGPTNDGTYQWWFINDGQGEGWAAEGRTGGEKWLSPR
ncbi:MAG: FHA domain-containing protein [Dehalococcoidia bacterium]|nr:FHA domain-containing protein [Dehalococcoidia bacterium]